MYLSSTQVKYKSTLSLLFNKIIDLETFKKEPQHEAPFYYLITLSTNSMNKFNMAVIQIVL